MPAIQSGGMARSETPSVRVRRGRDEEHEEVAEGEDAQSGEVVVFVEVSQTGDHAECGRHRVAVDGFPGVDEFFHGGMAVDFRPIARFHGCGQMQEDADVCVRILRGENARGCGYANP